MRNLLFRWLINALALGVAAMLLPGIRIDGDWRALAVTALIFGLVNAFIRPLVTLLTCPLVILTLGLFTLVINAGMLVMASWLAQSLGLGFSVEGFWTALVGGIIISLVSAALSILLADERRPRRAREADWR